MQKLENRARICLLLAAVLFLGLVVFTWRLVVHGAEWATFYGNTQIYTNGMINRGTVYDRNDVMLMQCTPNGVVYPDSSVLRMSTVHAVGDPKGNMSTGAINMWKGGLIGYNLLNGTYDTTKDGKKITLNIDSKANVAAYEALGSHNGTVGVFNYKTGEILTMVCKPSFDPLGTLPSDPDSSIYFNPFLQGLMTPGSTFKLVTSAAAIEYDPDIDSFSFTCDGVNHYGNAKFACTGVHGTSDFERALAVSCNGAFGAITREVGADNMKKEVKACGLTSSMDINGIKTAAGSFDFPSDDEVALSWAGIGQGKDQVNPAAMMAFVGSIANGGKAIQPSLIKNSNIIRKVTGGKSMGEYMSQDTADRLKSMMKNNVEVTYGTGNFPGLDIYAKSGTAEVGTDKNNGWFVGFIDDPDHPYAFVIWVQGGGTGYQVGGPIANDVLNTLIQDN
jgi:peptidoglycan glycosyltransferase